MEIKRYIGDGVYVEFDFDNLILTSEDGINVLDRIVLDPSSMQQLAKFSKDIMEVIKQEMETEE